MGILIRACIGRARMSFLRLRSSYAATNWRVGAAGSTLWHRPTRFSTSSSQSETKPLFQKILIANRGEIACRVIKTARKLGVQTVSVFSEADKNSMHVKMADEAFHIGNPPAKESYLRGDYIIDIAKRCGAQAIHPGYGFLSENAEFAEKCHQNGVVFIGPPSGAIRDMGSKSASKHIMQKANVPVVPGYHGDDQSIEVLQREADAMGYPVLIKAWMGGGGKGMRIVHDAKDFSAAVDSARREASSSFGDDRVLVEKYLVRPRHIELQVFADAHGNCVYVFERDCSVQRRHQKVVEEAPAPGMTEEKRREMGEAAVNAAKAVGYVGAGTVEFIVDEDLSIHGHAMEVRIYAENPDNDFLPGTGQIKFMKTPEESENVRIDTGVSQGDEVSVFYDPMIAKLIVWDKDRQSAIRKMYKALQEFQIVGLATNISFLKKVIMHNAFVAGDVDTKFIEEYKDQLLTGTARIPADSLALAAVYTLMKESPAPSSSLSTTNCWSSMPNRRFNIPYKRSLQLTHNGEPVNVVVSTDGQGALWQVELEDGEILTVSATLDGENGITAQVQDHVTRATVVPSESSLFVFHNDDVFELELPEPSFTKSSASSGSLMSPMPGRVIKVNVKAGDTVQEGDCLMIMEAMKMEHQIKATSSGQVRDVFFQVGDLVEAKKVLIDIDSGEE